MRVTRRARPSQVGCGASAARRRLLHAHVSDSPPALEPGDQVSMNDLSMVIQLDFFSAREMSIEPAQRIGADRLENQVPLMAGASARGW